MTFDRVVGTILGGAIGDGWGRVFEGSAPGTPAHAPEELVITDDTQLTLATCEAVVAGGETDPELIAARFVAWFRAGRLRGLGASTLKALRDLDAGAHWALSGARGERSAGNGAAMRIAPLAWLVDPSDEGARRTLRDVCRITHHHDEAYVGALAVVIAIRLASSASFAPSTLLADVARGLPDSQVRDRIAQLAALGDGLSPMQVAASWGCTGFVADSVPLALFAARDIRRLPFAEMLQRTIEAGGDADTIGSITGQIAGAALGRSGLPAYLIARLREGREIADVAESFGRFAASRD
jgi:ADP-ribosylglycohydrolase